MKSPIGLLIAGLSALIMAGCETLPKEPVSGIESIGVISAIGDTLNVQGIGTTVFQNKLSSGEVDEWNLDEKLADALVRKLTAAGYAAKREEIEIADFAPDDKSRGIEFFSGKEKFDWQGAIKAHESRSPGPHPDAYLLVRPVEISDDSFRHGQFYGVGIYSDSFIGIRSTLVFVAANMSLYDAGDVNLNRQASLRVKPGSADGKRRGSYFQMVDNDLWPQSLDAMSDAQRDAILAAIEKLAIDSLDETLKALKITPEEIETAATP